MLEQLLNALPAEAGAEGFIGVVAGGVVAGLWLAGLHPIPPRYLPRHAFVQGLALFGLFVLFYVPRIAGAIVDVSDTRDASLVIRLLVGLLLAVVFTATSTIVMWTVYVARTLRGRRRS